MWKHFRAPPHARQGCGAPWVLVWPVISRDPRNPKIQHSALANSGRGLIGCCGNHSDGSGRTRSRVAAAFGNLLSLEIFCSFLSTPTPKEGHLELRIIQPLIDLAVFALSSLSLQLRSVRNFISWNSERLLTSKLSQKKSSKFPGRVDRTDRIIDGGWPWGERQRD